MVRECGPCVACCYGAEINEGFRSFDGDTQIVHLVWHKPRRLLCQYADQNIGCSIHENKPQACANFQCLWLRGDLAEGMRPHEIGVVFWEEFIPELNMVVVAAEEAWLSAQREQRFWDVVHEVAQEHVVFVFRKGAKRRLLFRDKKKDLIDIAKPEGLTDAVRVPLERIQEEQRKVQKGG